MRIALSPAARRDRRTAEAWYRRESPAAARGFRLRLNEALEYVSQYPEGAPVTPNGRRAKSLSHYPFTVIYEIRPNRIRVVAIADERRDPDA